MQEKGRYEVIIHGRGGQGAKTSAEVLVQAAVKEGKFVQAFPEFGPERSGAPMRTFVRISNDPIRNREPVVDPDCVLVLDETIVFSRNVTNNLTGKEPLIINSKRDKQWLASRMKFKGHIVPIDASGMSKKIIGEYRPNTVILGKFAFVTETVKLENIIDVFKEKYTNKIGRETTDKNIEAIRSAYGM